MLQKSKASKATNTYLSGNRLILGRVWQVGAKWNHERPTWVDEKGFQEKFFLSPRNMQNFALLWGIFTYKHINLRLEKMGSPTWTVEYAIHVVVNSQHIISELRCGGNSPTDVAEKHTDYQIRQCCTNKSLYAKKAQPHLFLPSLSP